MLAFLAGLPFARGLMRRRREVLVAAPAAAALGDEQRLAGGDQLAEDFARLGVADFGARGDWQVHVVTGLPRHVFALAMLSALGDPARVIAVVEQRGEVGIGPYEYASPSSAIATIRSPLGDKFLPSE